MSDDSSESACKKRKADILNDDDEEEENEKSEEEEEAEDEASTCNICFEPWSNTGTHRISSLKCGHFFGLACIDKWLQSTGGNDCPTCNEKACKRDIRHHYVARLKAVDTGDRDRAIRELEALRKEFRSLSLEHATLKVTNHLQKEEIERLRNLLKSSVSSFTNANLNSANKALESGVVVEEPRLVYVKRLELIKQMENREKCCRLLAYNDTYGMLVVSQPSFTALAPGFGVRRVNMLDQKLESFVALHKEPLRDLCFNPVKQDQLLSVSQDKTARLTNMGSCAEIQRYQCSNELWSCCWHAQDPHVFFVGTKRSEIFLYDTRECAGPKMKLEFPVEERRPIIGLAYVPRNVEHRQFPCAGLLVQTLGSLWFFEETAKDVFSPTKLNVQGLFWCLRFDIATRLMLVSTRPTPHARHMVCELSRINVSSDPAVHPDFQVTVHVVFDNRRGGSYKERAFLRSHMCQKPGSNDGQVVALFGRGSAMNDHKLVVQEVGSDKVLQQLQVDKPVLDVCPLNLNSDQFVTVLCENEMHIYKWT